MIKFSVVVIVVVAFFSCTLTFIANLITKKWRVDDSYNDWRSFIKKDDYVTLTYEEVVNMCELNCLFWKLQNGRLQLLGVVNKDYIGSDRSIIRYTDQYTPVTTSFADYVKIEKYLIGIEKLEQQQECDKKISDDKEKIMETLKEVERKLGK